MPKSAAVKLAAGTSRTRTDMCPGVLRPWSADDGLLVRLRLIGGRLPVAALTRLLDVSAQFSDGTIHLTTRANLQLRGLPGRGGQLAPEALAAIEATGLVPSRSHELVRNVMVSPQTGHAGGRADLRPVATRLDALLCAEPQLADLPGRFLFTLDDGRGDLLDRTTDAGMVALSTSQAQLRVGDGWGDVVGIEQAAGQLAELARAFQSVRGRGPGAPWHVRELATPLRPPVAADHRLPSRSGPLPYGEVPGGNHVRVPDGVLTGELADALLAGPELVVTPWHGILIPQAQETTP